ncbi:MAG: YbjN domain-containing protein [bacterium]
MPSSTSHFELDGPLTFASPSGDSIEAQATDIALERADGVLTEVRITFHVPPETYRGIAAAGNFNLTPETRSPAADDFVADADVQLEARLDPRLIPGVAVLGDDILQAGPAFAALAPGSPLLESESWFALSVTKEVLRDAEGGSLREGFSTLHAADPDFLTLPIIAIAAAAFEERDLDWQETTDDEVIRAEVTGENGAWAVFAVAREKDRRCTVYSQAAWSTPEDQRDLMAETITRINFGLPLGNFEMDYTDGEVRFKTSIDVTGARMTTSLFEDLYEPNISTMDMYLPALEAVRDARMEPEAAVKMVEDA